MDNCPLCGRELDSTADLHHLVPKSKKGKETIRLHKICHSKIHSLYDEKVLAKHYNTIEKLLESEDIQRFIKWIKKKPIDYNDKSIMSNKHSWKKR